MNIKKKISVWCALFALLVALVPPSSAKAEEVDVDKLLNEACTALVNDSTLVDLVNMRKYYAIGYNYTNERVEMIIVADGVEAVCTKYVYGGIYLCSTVSGASNVSGELYFYSNGVWNRHSSGKVSIGYDESTVPKVCASSFDYVVNLSNSDGVPTVFEYVAGYTFASWCSDAGLNCYASSNESTSVIPYSYNDYWHIVRKTSSGKWLLTTIGSTIGQAKMSLRLSEDLSYMKIYEYSGDDSFVISVRQFEYDADGWKLRSYGSYGYDDFTSGIVELPAGTGINSTVGLAYTSADIYTSDGLAVYASASTECAEPLYPDVTPPSTEEPTPTVTPSTGVQNQTLYMYSVEYIGSVVSANASLYEVCNGTDDDILVDLLKGMRVKVHGWTTDTNGDMWYYCTYTNVYEGEVTGEFTGFIKSNSIGLTYSSGDTDEEQDMTLKEQLQVISSFVLSVPMIISALFSFMPPWSLTLVGIAFSIAAILMLRKG